MKVGSLVELIDDRWPNRSLFPGAVYIPVKGVIYTIREIYITKSGATILRLVEIINPPILTIEDGFGETGFNVRRFRELLPPMQAEIKALLEQPELA